MAFSMFSASVPVFAWALKNLGGLLEAGRADAEARGYAPEVLLGARLAPDMFPLTRQVQIACDMVKNGAARLAGVEPVAMPDTEATFAELAERLAKTIAYVEGLDAQAIEGSAERPIVLKFPRGEMNFAGAAYLNQFVLPNLYFHMTTAYNILRHNGVKIGKTEFLGG